VLRSDVKHEKFDCEKTDLSGITDRSQRQQYKLHCTMCSAHAVCMHGPTKGDWKDTATIHQQ